MAADWTKGFSKNRVVIQDSRSTGLQDPSLACPDLGCYPRFSHPFPHLGTCFLLANALVSSFSSVHGTEQTHPPLAITPHKAPSANLQLAHTITDYAMQHFQDELKTLKEPLRIAPFTITGPDQDLFSWEYLNGGPYVY